MKICILTPWFPTPETPYGGLFVAQQADALASRGHEVTVVHLDPKSAVRIVTHEAEAAQRVWAHGAAAVYRMPNGPNRYQLTRVPFLSVDGSGFHARAQSAAAALERQWARIVSDHGPFDLIHAHVTLPAGFAAGRSAPLVVTEHFTGVDRVLNQASARTAFTETIDRSRFLCVSEFLRLRIADIIGDEWLSKMSVVPNLVDFAGLDFTPRSSYGKHWLFVGSLNPRKNVDRLIKVFHEFCKRGNDAELTIVGDGEMGPQLKALTHRLRLDARVSFRGSLDKKQTSACFRAADLLVHLSSLETFGLTAVEAIASGMPVVSFANGGAECAWGEIEPKVGTILSPHLGPSAIADRVERVVSSDSLDLQAASGWVRFSYSPDSICRKLEAEYAAVTA